MAKKKSNKVKEEGKVVSRSSELVSTLKKLSDDKIGSILSMDGLVDKTIPKTSSGILSFDLALCGGFPHGRLIEIFGPEMSGKTTATLHAIASVQQRGGVCAFVDAEHSLDLSYAEKLGVNVNELVIQQPDYGEQAFEAVISIAERMRPGDMIVVDSVDALIPKKELDGELLDPNMGLKPLMMGRGVKKSNTVVAKHGVIGIFVNQIRMKVGITYGSNEDTPGGKALKYYASQRVDVRKTAKVKGKNDEIVGVGIKFKVIKNKVAPPFRTAESQIRFGEGVPRYLDVFLMASASNVKVIEQSGSWYSYNGAKLGNGLENALEHLKTRPELVDELEEKVLEKY